MTDVSFECDTIGAVTVKGADIAGDMAIIGNAIAAVQSSEANLNFFKNSSLPKNIGSGTLTANFIFSKSWQDSANIKCLNERHNYDSTDQNHD